MWKELREQPDYIIYMHVTVKAQNFFKKRKNFQYIDFRTTDICINLIKYFIYFSLYRF